MQPEARTLALNILNYQRNHGFSITNLQYFRKFYLTWPDRLSIQHPPGVELVKLCGR